MKLYCVFLVALACVSGIFGEGVVLKCTLKPADIKAKWIDMVDPCILAMESQVRIEIDASMRYLAMGAHFARDTINRPGFSKYFFDSASEEREHAIKIIEYLLMRGQLTNNVSKLLKFPLNSNDTLHQEWKTGEEALQDALKLEAQVTKSVRNIIITCETPKTSDDSSPFNDYHLVDYLITDFLEEQYKGQRDLAGKISVLGKMMQTHGHLGEFLFDKKLLHGEV
jgi:ferritin heavy chain